MTHSRTLVACLVGLAILATLAVSFLLGHVEAQHEGAVPVPRSGGSAEAIGTGRSPDLHECSASEGFQGRRGVRPGSSSSTEEVLDELEVWLERIRASEDAPGRHQVTWPSVLGLAELARNRPESIPRMSALVVGSETEFVRAAVLMSLGSSGAGEVTQLAEGLLNGPPGELTRAAWIVLALARGEGVGDGLDLSGFQSGSRWIEGGIWPATLPPVSREAAVGALELAVLHLVPPRFYRDAPEDPTRPSSWREEGILTREVILLSTLAIPAMEPGGARNRLLEWHADSDMRQACIWSLCLAARTDEALALELRELVLVGSLSSEAGQSLARMIEEIAGRGDLVLDLLTAELQRHETTDLEGDHVRNVVALVAMSELLASENSELASAALEQVVGIAIDPTRSEDLRFLTLAQLSALRQEQVGDAIELILVSQDESSAREWAARFATAVPPDQQPRMRDLLIETFAYGGGAGQKEALQSLTWMGGPEVDAFVASWNGSKDLSPEAQAVIDEYLAGDG